MLETSTLRPPLGDADVEQVLARLAGSYKDQIRSPILKTPADAGLAFEEVSFPAEDGVRLEGWFIPRPGSDRLVICNHPRWFNRYGCPSHLEPWRAIGAMGGNDFEVDFIPDYRILHDAGYNVLAYDLRNHGGSAASEGGLVTSGVWESRDVVGSLAFARAEHGGMAIALFSRCLGCNSALVAAGRRPNALEGVRAFLGVQPLSVEGVMQKMIALQGVAPERIEDLSERVRALTGFRLDDFSPAEPAKRLTVPTLLYGVRDDVMTTPDDLQATFDNVGAQDKTLFWITGTTRRWDGYTYFARHPERILAWLDGRMR